MGLQAILEAAAKGAAHKHNRETLGPDYQERIAALRSKLANEKMTREAQAAALGKSQREDGIAQRAELLTAEGTEGLGGDSPSDAGPTQVDLDPSELIARLRAKQAAEAQGLTTRKAEADIGLVEANTGKALAAPEAAEAKLELEKQKLQAMIDRSRDAGERAMLGMQMKQLQMQQSQMQFEGREARLERMFAGRNHIPAGTQEKLLGMANSMRQLSMIEQKVQDPASAALLGPVRGRTVSALMEYLGGATVSPAQKELKVLLEGALSTEAFENGGKALTGTELGRFRQTSVSPNDTLETALSKLRTRREILNGRFDDITSLFSQTQQNQAQDFMGRVEPNRGPGVSGARPPASVDGVPPGQGNAGGQPQSIPPGYKLQRNPRTGETRMVPK